MESAFVLVGIIALIEFFLVMGLQSITKRQKEEIAELEAERHRLLTETVKKLKRKEMPCDSEGVFIESGDIHGSD